MSAPRASSGAFARPGRRHAGFFHAGRRSAGLDDVHIGLVGHFGDASHRLVVEIGLLADPILGGDLPATVAPSLGPIHAT